MHIEIYKKIINLVKIHKFTKNLENGCGKSQIMIYYIYILIHEVELRVDLKYQVKISSKKRRFYYEGKSSEINAEISAGRKRRFLFG